MKCKILAVSALLLFGARSAAGAGFTLPSTGAGQVLLVLTADWASPRGTLYRFHREGKRYQRVGAALPVVVGRNGLAWGRGLHPVVSSSGMKQEGDGRAPAGVFALGNAMGYAATPPATFHTPYVPSTSTTVCIDDPASSYYNHVVDTNTVGTPTPWKSAETLLRNDGLYEWLLLVQHNWGSSARAGDGSCIFVHVWRRPDLGTDGCTAMDKAALVEILSWLRPDQQPVLIQLPRAEYQRLATLWQLPQLSRHP